MKYSFLKTLTLCTMLIMGSCFVADLVHAQNSFEIPFAENGSKYIGEIASEQFSFAESQTTGIRGIQQIIHRILQYLQYILGGIGVIYFVIAGYRLIVAGGKADEIATQQKLNITWIIVGFIVVTIADVAVNQVFFRGQGTFLQTQESAIEAAKFGAQELRRVINFFVAFVGSGAILAIIVAGMRMIMSPGNEEVASAQKKVIMWSSLGLILMNLADRVVYIFYNEGGTEGINVQAGLVEIAGLANYVLGFLGVIAAATIVYAGFIMIANFGNSEAVSKAKTLIRDVALGIIIAFSAYTIVSAIVQLGS